MTVTTFSFFDDESNYSVCSSDFLIVTLIMRGSCLISVAAIVSLAVAKMHEQSVSSTIRVLPIMTLSTRQMTERALQFLNRFIVRKS